MDFEAAKTENSFIGPSYATFHGGFNGIKKVGGQPDRWFAILGTAARLRHLLIRNAEKTFTRISILSAPINRTTQRVNQIYLQIKKLIFLKIGFLGCGCFQGGFSSSGLDICEYICVWVCAHAHGVCACARLCVCACTCACVCEHVCIHVLVCVRTCAYVDV